MLVVEFVRKNSCLVRWLVMLTLIFTAACHDKPQSDNKELPSSHITSRYKVNLKYAKRFTIDYYPDYTLVTLKQPWTGAEVNFHYALVSDQGNTSNFPDSIQVVEIPVKKVVATSTTHLPSFEYLNAIDRLVGFPNTGLISSEKIRKAIDEKKVIELGSEAGMNLETLLAVSPDLVMDFAMGNDYDKYKAVKKVGIPVVLNADYMEESPLGRAEWIKFIGLFLGKEEMADSIFNEIEYRYDSLLQLVGSVEPNATVFSGIVYGDIWYLPGGENFGAKFLSHAKGNYLWNDNHYAGWIQLGFENVYQKANDADFWIGLSDVKSLEELKNMDSRYTNFKAYQTGNVYNYNARVGETGGNEYLELGYLRPDIILADLIKILHPDLLPDYSLYFYQKLN